MVAAFELRLQHFDRAPDDAALQLHETPVEGDPAVHRREESECAFASDIGGLDRRAVVKHRQQRQNTASGKVGVSQEPARLADNSTEPETHPL